MSTVNPTDKVLVNRAGVDYSKSADSLMADILDTDHLLVNRGGVDYKCTGADFKDAMKPPATIDKPIILAPADDAGITDPSTAVDPSGFVLTASAFSSTPAGALTQTAASWEVAAYADTTFTSPVAQVLSSTTDLTSWTVTPELAGDTQYRCRVKYISGTTESAWSDGSTFKTQAKGGFDEAAAPGDLYIVEMAADAQSATWKQVVSPVKMINATVTYNSHAASAVGVDNKLYFIADMQVGSPSAVATPISNIKAVIPSIPANSNASGFNTFGAYRHPDDTVEAIGTGAGACPTTGKVTNVSNAGTICSGIYVFTDTDGVWFTSYYNSHDLTELNAGYNAWVKLPFIHNDIIAACSATGADSNYKVGSLIYLRSNGELYCVGDHSNKTGARLDMGLPSGGTFAVPVRVTTNGANSAQFKALSPFGLCWSISSGIAAIDSNDTLWVGYSKYNAPKQTDADADRDFAIVAGYKVQSTPLKNHGNHPPVSCISPGLDGKVYSGIDTRYDIGAPKAAGGFGAITRAFEGYFNYFPVVLPD